MKKIKLAVASLFTMALIVAGTQNASAQKAFFNSKTARTFSNDLVSFTCSMEELKSKDAANALALKMKTNTGAKNVEVKNFSVNKADFVISMPKKQGPAVLQNSFKAAGIETVFVDNKPVKTSELAKVIKANKKKK